MHILCVATKPPWPPVDGGRLVLWLTLQGLARLGHRITLLAPCDEHEVQASAHGLASICTPALVAARRRPWATALPLALASRRALSNTRHHLPPLERALQTLLRTSTPDVLLVEQLQALSNCEPARRAGLPIVLRMQNVESDIWRGMADASARFMPLRLEASRLRRDEQRAVDGVDRVITLTEHDATVLRSLAPGPRADNIVALAPPFPPLLDAGPALPGTPCVALAGSGAWRPNADAMRWWIEHVFPPLMSSRPDAMAHLFSGPPPSPPHPSGLRWHKAPDDAANAFPGNAIAAIPLRIGSGIRMRILEAWARGLPVVASSVAARGLHVEGGRELLVADPPQAFRDALLALADDPALADALRQHGRAYLREHHDPVTQSERLAHILSRVGG